MPLARFDRLEPERQLRLLATAAQEFATHGFEGASLARITEGAGMSKAALYYYFEDKADLYAAAIREAWRELSPTGRFDVDSLDAASFWPTLRDYFRDILERYRQEPWLVAAWQLAHHAPREASAAWALAGPFDEAQAFLERLLERGQALGVVRDDLPRELLVALITAADRAADHWIIDHWESLPPAQVERLTLSVFEALRGLATPPAPGPPASQPGEPTPAPPSGGER